MRRLAAAGHSCAQMMVAPESKAAGRIATRAPPGAGARALVGEGGTVAFAHRGLVLRKMM